MQRLKIFKIEGCTPHKSGKIRVAREAEQLEKRITDMRQKRKMAPYRIQAEKPLEDQKIAEKSEVILIRQFVRKRQMGTTVPKDKGKVREQG